MFIALIWMIAQFKISACPVVALAFVSLPERKRFQRILAHMVRWPELSLLCFCSATEPKALGSLYRID